MAKIKFPFSALVVLVFSLVFTSVAEAQVPRTFVSAFGSDSNPCDHPIRSCRNIQSALTKVQAGGEVVIISSGSYQPFTVNKPVTVAAAPGEHVAISVSSGHGAQINVGSADVVILRGLTLNGFGGLNGIQFNDGGALHVENCVVNGFSGSGIGFFGDGQLFLKDTIVRNNGSHGIFLDRHVGAIEASVDHSRLERNGGDGLSAHHNVKVTIRDSVAAGNTFGFQANVGVVSGATTEMNIENCLVTGNQFGIKSRASGGGTAIVRVSNSTITNNDAGLLFDGGSLLSRGNNTVEGNTTEGSFTGTFSAK